MFFSEAAGLAAARRIFEHMGATLQAGFSVRLWDGSMVPLGEKVQEGFFVAINADEWHQERLRGPTLHPPRPRTRAYRRLASLRRLVSPNEWFDLGLVSQRARGERRRWTERVGQASLVGRTVPTDSRDGRHSLPYPPTYPTRRFDDARGRARIPSVSRDEYRCRSLYAGQIRSTGRFYPFRSSSDRALSWR